MPWRDLERVLSDRSTTPAPADPPEGASGGDSPAWSRKRAPYEPPAGLTVLPGRDRSPYAELHCHSAFSFLDGVSTPEELVEEAVRLDLDALALTDHNGLYGVVRFAEAARAVGMPTVFGAELTLGAAPKAGQPDPAGSHLLVIARDPQGYAALARVLSEAHLAGEKGAPQMQLDDVAGWLQPGDADHWLVLTGCRKGLVPRTLLEAGPAEAQGALQQLVEYFGRDNVGVELWDHGDPLDSARNDAMVQLAHRVGVEPVATNNVHYATPADRRPAMAMAAVRARRSLDEMNGWLPAHMSAHLRSGAEQQRRFSRYPGVVDRAAAWGRECAFDLALVAPKLPPFPCPDGLSEMAFLRRLVEDGGAHRYGPRHDERVRGAWAQLDRELELIEQLGFPGYFLVVWDIVRFCLEHNIYCQGRGSAANSAVCYVLGITKADAVRLDLLFERFLSPERDGPPDIDLDIESDRREEVIQYVYERHGRRHAAQVANVITYRARSAIRDAAKALGYAPGQQDAFAKLADRWSSIPEQSPSSSVGSPRSAGSSSRASSVRSAGSTASVAHRGAPSGNDGVLPEDVRELARRFSGLPRHLGIHSGGMVMCDRPVVEVCPVERARMPGRTVLQWDKDDCAAIGLVKFDLLGLGMLSALHYAVDLIADPIGVDIDLADLPQEDAVYDMLCRADSVGVFQVESRAQMSTLPRLRPRTFYDLVVEVALIRPGPIQGGSVHPYIRRRNGQEPVTYLHPLLERSLAKTLGIPLFQEQLMQMAMDVAGFSAAESDELRRAMGSKRSAARMERLRQRFHSGSADRGVSSDIAAQIWEKLAAFANYGFPESHSISFAYLVYASSWIKLHYPAAFCAALLRAQPMGFYSPHSLVEDARRHGVRTQRPDINVSGVEAGLEPDEAIPLPITEMSPLIGESIMQERHDHGWAVRLGLASVRGIGEAVAQQLIDERLRAGPYRSIEDVARRCPMRKEQFEALATAGAFVFSGAAGTRDAIIIDQGDAPSPMSRRQALWVAGAVAQRTGGDRLAGIVTGVHAPQLPGMSEQEEALADLWATGIAPNGHPTRFLRELLSQRGITPANELAMGPSGGRILVAGIVTHRQRPATAGGVTFLGLEDETGLMNVVVSPGCWVRFAAAARSAPALLIRGRLERAHSVINIVADRLEPLPLGTGSMSRDFR